DLRIAPRQERRIHAGLMQAREHRNRSVPPRPPDLLVVLELIDRPDHPERAAPWPLHEAQKPRLGNGDIEMAALRPRSRERLPNDALVLDRAVAVRVDGHRVRAARELAGELDHRGFGAAERLFLQIGAVVTQGLVGKDDAGHPLGSARSLGALLPTAGLFRRGPRPRPGSPRSWEYSPRR